MGSSPTNGATNNGSGMKGLSPELILKLMAKGRSRNTYGPKLIEFVESDEAAINPREVWPVEFTGKEASTLYQGFRTATNKANLVDTIEVKQSDGEVFLLHKARVELALAPTS